MIESIFSAPDLFMIGGIGRIKFDATSEKSKKGTLKKSPTKQTKWCLNINLQGHPHFQDHTLNLRVIVP